MTPDRYCKNIVKRGVQKLRPLVLKRFGKEKQQVHFSIVKGGSKNKETSGQAMKLEILEEVSIGSYKSITFLCHYNNYIVGGRVNYKVDVFLISVLQTTISLVDTLVKTKVFCLPLLKAR
jgi:hypothetical protein